MILLRSSAKRKVRDIRPTGEPWIASRPSLTGIASRVEVKVELLRSESCYARGRGREGRGVEPWSGAWIVLGTNGDGSKVGVQTGEM
jgi:hypothetical protein